MSTEQEFQEKPSQDTVLELLTEEVTTETNTTAPEKTTLSGSVREFLLSIEKMGNVEEKISSSIDFMKSRLLGSSSPKFREFWEVKKISLPFFKENLSAKARAEFWTQYIDLSVEARRLKEILDEQSAFAYEQIDLAVQALVEDLNSYEERLSQIPDIEVPIEAFCLSSKKEIYSHSQKQLNLLNAFAAKINALRKEVIKTDMRIRSKNKLFEKLSDCGNKVFPQRKELIRQISEDFLKDVTSFSKKHFESDFEPSISLKALRDEIKSLQSFAKLLTLNTQSFTDTRLQLSSCWEKLKVWDKEKKKEFAQKKLQQKESYDLALLKIREFESFCSEASSLEKVEEKHREILQAFKAAADLGFEEMRDLRNLLNAARRPLEEKARQARLEIEAQEKAIQAERLLKIEALKEAFKELFDKAETLSLEELLSQKEILEEKTKAFSFFKSEKVWIDRNLKLLKDRILEVKSSRILSLSDSDQERHNQLNALLQEQKERRNEVKNQLDSYRKIVGGSGFDFEKAILYRELIESEKGNLERMDKAIGELEEKIAEIEG